MTRRRAGKHAIKSAIGLRGIKEVRILAGPAKGVVMKLDFSGHTPMYLGMYEWELHRFIGAVLRPARTVIDVGGHLGYHALMAAANMPGRVFTFEPDPDRAKALRYNARLNPDLGSRITVRPQAVERTAGSDATTLDAISAEAGPPDLIKIDIDGGEANALYGGLATLRAHRPSVVVETHSLALEQECGALLVECGYRPIIKHNRRVWREHRAGAPHNRWLLADGRGR